MFEIIFYGQPRKPVICQNELLGTAWDSKNRIQQYVYLAGCAITTVNEKAALSYSSPSSREFVMNDLGHYLF